MTLKTGISIFASLLSLVPLALTQGCTSHADEDDGVHATVTAAATGAEFDVEVRYGGGLTRQDAENLLAEIEVAPATVLFPEVDMSALPDEDASAGSALDESEPTFHVVLHPRNAAAAATRHAWRVRTEGIQSAGLRRTEEGLVGTTRQGLSADVTVGVYLDPGESWRTARQRCRAFGFAADVMGIADVCIDLGYEGKADHMCSFAFDPREPVLLFHPGPNWDPTDKHYFRGRVTAKTYFGKGLPTAILAAGYACL